MKVLYFGVWTDIISLMLGVSLRYSERRHTGRLRPHGESSYGLMLFLLLCIGVILLSISASASASQPNPGPKNGAFSVTASVNGPRPATPAIITTPNNGQSFSADPIDVAGTCPDKSLVKIFTNDIFVGSAICDSTKHFKLKVDLVIGSNRLTALPFNALDQSGPDSPAVNLTLVFPNNGLGFSQQLLLQSSNFYRGAMPGDKISWPLEIVGGVSPYALNFDWGDGKSDLLTRPQAGAFNLDHVYDKVGGYLGTYPLTVKATDSAGNHAYLQLTSIVNAPKGATNASTSTVITPNFKFIWPLWIVLLLMVFAFWLGERREKKIMERHMAALA